MSSKLNFTISVPDSCLSQMSFLASANQPQTLTPQPIRDSMNPSSQVSQNATHCFSKAWNKVVNFLKYLWDYLCCKKKTEASSPEVLESQPAVQVGGGNPVDLNRQVPESGHLPHLRPVLTTEELERRRAVQERELAVWHRQMAINLKQPDRHSNFVDLSGQINGPGYCQALQMEMDGLPQIGHYGENYILMNRYLAVKLPARQLHRFPDTIRNALSNYDADHLDIYFMIWQDIPRVYEDAHQRGKRNLIYHPIAYPNARVGETHNHNLSMGIFDTEGIERASGAQWQVMPFNQFSEQNVHIHPGLRAGVSESVMCISPDDARFYLPDNRAWSTFNSACKLPNGRAVAVFGVILNPNGQTPESQVLASPLVRRGGISLQEYKNGIQSSSLDSNLKGKMLNVLDFYTE